jgi:hypothetical protein
MGQEAEAEPGSAVEIGASPRDGGLMVMAGDHASLALA